MTFRIGSARFPYMSSLSVRIWQSFWSFPMKALMPPAASISIASCFCMLSDNSALDLLLETEETEGEAADWSSGAVLLMALVGGDLIGELVGGRLLLLCNDLFVCADLVFIALKSMTSLSIVVFICRVHSVNSVFSNSKANGKTLNNWSYVLNN